MRTIISACLILFAGFFLGCARDVSSTLSPDWASARPYTVAVMPIEWKAFGAATEKEKSDVSYVFRVMTRDRLKAMNYSTVPLERIDEEYLKLGSARFSKMKPREAAALFNADAVLYVRVTTWDTDRLATYASLKMAASFDIHSQRGTLLWSASHTTKESDLRLDTAPLELAVIKAYEPRVQRFISAVFSKLPVGEEPAAKRSFYNWLP